jgi:glycosyl transferase family 25
MSNDNLENNIWIINLDKSKDRMDKIKKNFEEHKIKFNRFSAIYGKNVSDEYIDKNVSFMCKNFLCNYGLIGCAASHKTLWKQLINSKENFYIIFEDDIELTEKSFKIINKIIPYLNNKEYDIDYLNLNCINYGCGIHKTIFSIDEYKFGKPYIPLSTGSYIITKKGANKLLNYISNNSYHIDFEILFVKFFSNFNYYASNISIVNLTNDETTIGMPRKTLTSIFLKYFNYDYLSWSLNIPLFTIKLFYEINVLIILLLLLLLLNNKYLHNGIIFWFVILELFLLHRIYL